MATLLETAVPSLLGVGDAIVIKNKSTATSQGSISINTGGEVILGGDSGITVTPTSSTSAFHIQPSTGGNTFSVDTVNNRVAVNTNQPPTTLYVNGVAAATSDVITNYSDERLKTNLNPIENALEKVNSLRGFDYDNVGANPEIGFEPSRKSDVGLSAQEVQKVLPHAVCTAPFDLDVNSNSKSGENYLTIRYERVVPLLVEAIKELSAKLDSHNH